MIALGALLVLGVFAIALRLWRGPLSHPPGDHRGELARIAAALEANAIDDGLQLERRLTAIEEQLDRLPSKWQDIKREAKSYYERARHHVRRTQAELEERGLRDPELDGLDRELRLVHGDGGGAQGVPAVSPGVEAGPAPQQAPAFEDYLTAANRRKFGGNA